MLCRILESEERDMRFKLTGFFAAALLLLACVARTGNAATEIEELRAEVAKLREAVNAQRLQATPTTSPVDTLMDNKYGPDAKVSTRAGKLTIGGLVQVWYYN